jgi:hypothetical protein
MKRLLAELLWYITDLGYSIAEVWFTLSYRYGHSMDDEDPL